MLIGELKVKQDSSVKENIDRPSSSTNAKLTSFNFQVILLFCSNHIILFPIMAHWGNKVVLK